MWGGIALRVWAVRTLGSLFRTVVVIQDKQQVPRSPRRNKLPVKRIDGALLMRHEHLAGALVELSQIAKTAACTNRVFHRPREAFGGIEVGTTVGPGEME